METSNHPLSGKQYLKIGRFTIRRGRLNVGMICYFWGDRNFLGSDRRAIMWDFPFAKGLVWFVPRIGHTCVVVKFQRYNFHIQPSLGLRKMVVFDFVTTA